MTTEIPATKRLTIAVLAIGFCGLMFVIERSRFSDVSLAVIPFGAAIVVYYLYLMFNNAREVFLSSIYQIYAMLGLLVSAMTISGGAVMLEVNARGTANGTFWVLLAFLVAGMEATYFGFKSHWLAGSSQKAPTLPSGLTNLSIIAIAGVTILLGLYVFATIGSPVLIGVDRVTFWKHFTPEYLSFFPSLTQQTYFFVCFLFLTNKKQNISTAIPSSILITYILVTIFILGEKLSAFVLVFSAWSMIVAGTFPNFKIKYYHIILTFAIVASLFAMISISYISSGREVSFIFSRIALQGQLLWSLLSDPYRLALVPSPDWQCYFGCGWIDNGKDFISYTYLPVGLYKFYYEGGTGLSGFMPALPIFMFGFAAAFSLHIIICFLLGICQRETCEAIRRNNFITSFLFYKIQLGLALAWFAAMSTALIGSLSALVLLVIYLAIFGRSTSRHSHNAIQQQP